MMKEDISEDRAKVKKGLVTALKCLSTITSSAAVVNPLFGVASSLIQVVLKHIDNEEMCTLKREFQSVNKMLDELSQMNRKAVAEIKKQVVNTQLSSVEANLKNQFRMFMKIAEAKPEEQGPRKEDFVQSYKNDGDDCNLHTLYDSVRGTGKVFSGPVLAVYLEDSGNHRPTIENLCDHLTYLFCIGIIALMGYTTIIGDDVEDMNEKWTKNMQYVHEKMQEALQKCS